MDEKKKALFEGTNTRKDDGDTNIRPDDLQARDSSEDRTNVGPDPGQTIAGGGQTRLVVPRPAKGLHEDTEVISKEDTIDDRYYDIPEANFDSDSAEDTFISDENRESTENMQADPTLQDRTAVMFGLSDIQDKLDRELEDISDDYEEELDPAEMSILIKSQFKERTDEEQLKINRYFLLDAEPFKLESLAEDMKKSPESLVTGFKVLDDNLSIPSNAVTLVASRPKHGKTSFMLNLLLNMCRFYPDKRFLFYSYEEAKWELVVKLINMCGSRQFNSRKGAQSNLERWKYEFKYTGMEKLREKSETDPEYAGLKNFLKMAGRIHIIGSKHTYKDLEDSVQSFAQAVDVGAVFIDSLQRIRLEKGKPISNRRQQLEEISEMIAHLAHDTRFPLVVSTHLYPAAPGTPEYDELREENLWEMGNPNQIADLVIGLQNYARSRYIGSNLDPGFKSMFYDQPLSRALPMPDNLKDMMQKTIIRARVISNKTGVEPETELMFHKQLLRILELPSLSGHGETGGG